MTFRLTYQPISLFRWQLYTAQAMRAKWTSFMGSDLMEQDEDEQDIIKETFLETSPVLLALTVIVSITHSVFEFLAFKNGILITIIYLNFYICVFCFQIFNSGKTEDHLKVFQSAQFSSMSFNQ